MQRGPVAANFSAVIPASIALSWSVALALAPPPLVPLPPADTGCASVQRSASCFDLLATPAVPAAAGTVMLEWVAGPFGVSVTRDGRHRFAPVLGIGGLPDPRSLGPYTTYVAWATTPELAPMLRLGEVGNGLRRFDPIPVEKLLLLVSAERSADVPERQGPLVLRGASASTLLVPHGVDALPPRASEHRHGPDRGWVMPPMTGRVAMVPGLEHLEPSVAPLPLGDPAPLPEARPTSVVRLADGDTLRLEATRVRRTVNGRSVVAYAYNGQIPGPRLEVAQGSRVIVEFVNRLDQRTAVHWHGIRLDNAADGVPGLTQPAVPPGGTFRYRLRFPDDGTYWYHPHHREDVQQDAGLAGNIVVRARGAAAWPEVDREEYLIVDDLLAGDAGPVPWGRETATHALMGRFGNLLQVNGSPAWRLTVPAGTVTRFHFTNAANARTFNLSFGDERLKLVASDGGRFERETWVESVPIAASERYVVETRFDRPGTVALVNRVQVIDRFRGRFVPQVDTLGLVTVTPPTAASAAAAGFDRLRAHPFAAPASSTTSGAPLPARSLVLTLRTRELPFGLEQALRVDTMYVHPVEWESAMPMMDWLSTGREVEWILRDAASGRENHALDWRFRRGETARLRIENDPHVLHPMAHPVHLHGQRFLVVAQNGTPVPNRVWKDTVLVPAGGSVDLLVEFSNPGRWMLHCHIAEHLETGMHATVTVE
jgi:suppressor of ftsI